MRLIAHQTLTQRSTLRIRHLVLEADAGTVTLRLHDKAPETAAAIELPPLSISAATLDLDLLRAAMQPGKEPTYPDAADGQPIFIVQPITSLMRVEGGMQWCKEDLIVGTGFLYRQTTTWESRYRAEQVPMRAFVLPVMARLDAAGCRRVRDAATPIGPDFTLLDLESAHARMRFLSGGYGAETLAA